MSRTPIASVGTALLLLSAAAAGGFPQVESESGGRAGDSDAAGRAEEPAADDRASERLQMVERQIAAPRDGRDPVRDSAVLAAMRAAPRHRFVPEDLQAHAYADSPLPIGSGQTISQPYIVAYMTELLQLTPESRVLEVGTGSGYQAAVLAELTPHVFTIEILEELAERARRSLAAAGYGGVHTRQGDGYHGWPEEAPFDAIIVTAAAGHLPAPLWEQLKPGGRVVIPIGGAYEVQRLVLVKKRADGTRESESLMGVRFVPLTGGAGTR
jgi:protein-L-isoaspartate(D-aspartate) O-methyltransferase